MKKSYKSTFLDESLVWDFHNAVQASDIFRCEEPLKHKYNLLCAFKDRMFSSVKYLNEHSNTPRTEEEFINFLVYAAIIRDGVNKVHENVYHKSPPFIDEKKHFVNVCTDTKRFFTEETQPTDDAFFEYIRAMAFAHPYETSKRGRNRQFMQDGEIQICPWVIVDRGYLSFNVKNAVGIRIYSNKFEEGLLDIIFSFDDLKAYIKSRFECIKEITEWATQELQEHKDQWASKKINRSQTPIETIQEIRSALNERFNDTYTIDEILSYLSCPLTCDENQANVALFRNAIIELIPQICDCVDSLDVEGMEQAIYSVLIRPQKMHRQAHYQLEKIFCYLEERSEVIDPYSNEAWGLKQAELFANEFAKKWVTINAQSMQYDEIKLLVSTACYLEAQEQNNELV